MFEFIPDKENGDRDKFTKVDGRERGKKKKKRTEEGGGLALQGKTADT